MKYVFVNFSGEYHAFYVNGRLEASSVGFEFGEVINLLKEFNVPINEVICMNSISSEPFRLLSEVPEFLKYRDERNEVHLGEIIATCNMILMYPEKLESSIDYIQDRVNSLKRKPMKQLTQEDLKYCITKGEMLEFLHSCDAPLDTPIVTERIEDVHFEKHGWGVHLEENFMQVYDEDGNPLEEFMDQFMSTHQASYRNGVILIYSHI